MWHRTSERSGLRLWLRSLVVLALILAALLPAGFMPARAAEPQMLLTRSYRYFADRDLVLLDLSNPLFVPVRRIAVTMTVRGAGGQILALGKAQLPANLVLKPGENTSVQVPVLVQIVPQLPAGARFEFMITGQPVDEATLPPPVMALGPGLELSKDADGVPWVMGFGYLDPLLPEGTAVLVESAVLSFYDSEGLLVWTEVVPFGQQLGPGETLMIARKFESLAPPRVTAARVEPHFVTVLTAP